MSFLIKYFLNYWLGVSEELPTVNNKPDRTEILFYLFSRVDNFMATEKESCLLYKLKRF